MGWEYRGANRYFYVKTRSPGGKVRSAYSGTEDTAELAAALVLAARASRRAGRDAGRVAARKARDVDRQVLGVCKVLRVLADAELLAAGFRRYGHRSWSKTPMSPMTSVQGKKCNAVRKAGLQDLVKQASAGDGKAIFAIKAQLRDDPAALVAVGFGDVAANAVSMAARDLSKRGDGSIDLLAWEATETKVRMVRDALAGPDPSPVERLLAERCAACWLSVWGWDLKASVNTGMAPERVDGFHTRAHNRYLSALRALSAVRRLDLSLVQVNIAQPAPPARLDATPEPIAIEATPDSGTHP